MCVRTKTSYTCGHQERSSNGCRDVDCPGLKKVHYIRRLKCPTCEEQPVSSPRGRKETTSRPGLSAPRERTVSRCNSTQRDSPASSLEDFTAESTTGTSPLSFDVSGGASPWAAPTAPRNFEKSWQTPHRRQADEAWLSEHEDRISELQASVSQLSLHKHIGSSTSLRKHAAEHDTDQGDESDGLTEDYASSSMNRSVLEMRKKVDDGSSRRSHSDGSQYRGRERQQSHDSLPDSMPSYHSSPLPRKYSSVQHYPAPVQEYDFYGSNGFVTPLRSSSKPHHGGAKAELYTYSPLGSGGSRVVGVHHPHSEPPSPLHRQPVFTPSPYDSSPKHYKPNEYVLKSAPPASHPYVRYHPRR